jgi:uncharacterized protein YutE (UPF0331/DUF86 family)
LRGGIISDELTTTLKQYLRFRHLFRHIYGFELRWERLEKLFSGLEEYFAALKSELEIFIVDSSIR